MGLEVQNNVAAANPALTANPPLPADPALTGNIANPVAVAQGDQAVVEASNAVAQAQAEKDTFQAANNKAADTGGKKKSKKAKKAEKKAEQKKAEKGKELDTKLQAAEAQQTTALQNQAKQNGAGTDAAFRSMDQQHVALAGTDRSAVSNYLNARYAGGGAAQAVVPQSQLLNTGNTALAALGGASGFDTVQRASPLLGGAQPTYTAPTFTQPTFQTASLANSLQGAGAGRMLTLPSGGGGGSVDPGGAFTGMNYMTAPVTQAMPVVTTASLTPSLLTLPSGGGGGSVDPGGAFTGFRAAPLMA